MDNSGKFRRNPNAFISEARAVAKTLNIQGKTVSFQGGKNNALSRNGIKKKGVVFVFKSFAVYMKENKKIYLRSIVKQGK